MENLDSILLLAASAVSVALGLYFRRELAGAAFLTLTLVVIGFGVISWFSSCEGELFKQGLRNCYPDDSYKGFYEIMALLGMGGVVLWLFTGLPLLALAWTSKLNRTRRRFLNHLPVLGVAVLYMGVLADAHWPSSDPEPCSIVDKCS